MDQENVQRLDDIRLDEIRQGFRIMAVPLDRQAALKAYGYPVIEQVRFSRINPGRKKRIGQAVSKAYFRDLQDESILSHKELQTWAAKRGEWTETEDKRLEELKEQVARLQEELYLDGASKANWDFEYAEAVNDVRDALKAAYAESESEKYALVSARFERWALYFPDRKRLYSERYAAEQGLEEYSPDRDLVALYDVAPSQEVGDLLDQIDDLKHKIHRFVEFDTLRTEWMELMEKHSRVFSESVEARRDNAESMARAYYCTERMDAQGAVLGPLTATFDELWELPEEFIAWLLAEAFMFFNNKTEADREYFAALGFPIAGPASSSSATNEPSDSAPSAESPAPPTSKPDSTPPAATAADSSA